MCSLETIGGWLTGASPLADPIIRAWHLMQAMGYDSPEMAKLADYPRYLGVIYTFNLMTIAELKAEIGLTTDQGAWEFLRGRLLAGGKKQREKEVTRLEALKTQYDPALQAILADLPRVKEAKPPISAPSTQAAPAPAHQTSQADPRQTFGVVLDPTCPDVSLATLVGLAVPYAYSLVDGTSDRRDRFRALLGKPAVAPLHTLLALLDALRTEAAHRQMGRSL